MRSDRQRPVAIVGGGFSGTMVAAHLARRGISSVIVEASERAGQGTAYSTRDDAHLLNVRAEGMSAWPGDPGHFSRLVEADGGSGRDFAQRQRFGRYLKEILDEALATGLVSLVRGEAIAAHPVGEDGWRLQLADRSAVEASGLVLAIGNQPPQELSRAALPADRFISNPWGGEARAAVAQAARDGSDVLILGTGLTMVDVVLSLCGAGYSGRISAVSRRGQIPRGHGDFDPAPAERASVPHGNVRALWRWLRHRSDQVGWRAAIDALRPHSHSLWQSLDRKEQERFLRHARPWWDVHRHRIAPQVAEQLEALIGEGRLKVVAGRVRNLAPAGDRIEASVAPRGGGEPFRIAAAHVFNCTGPLGAISRTGDPLLRQMLDEELASPDPLDIGLAVDHRSRIAGAPRAWALGPLTKGRYWEIIAVPDIREQAADVAADIATELER